MTCLLLLPLFSLEVDDLSTIVAIVLHFVNIHRPCGTIDVVIEPIRKTGDVPNLHLLSNHH